MSRSIISIADGITPAAMMSGDGGACRVHRVEAREQRPDGLGVRTTRSVIRVAMPSVPSEPTITPSRSGPSGIERLPAELDDLAVRQDERQPGDVVRRESVLEAVRAA